MDLVPVDKHVVAEVFLTCDSSVGRIRHIAVVTDYFRQVARLLDILTLLNLVVIFILFGLGRGQVQLLDLLLLLFCGLDSLDWVGDLWRLTQEIDNLDGSFFRLVES